MERIRTQTSHRKCLHQGGTAALTLLLVGIKIRVTANKVGPIEEDLVVYNTVILPENSLLQQLYQLHESKSVWRNVQWVKQLKKTIGIAPFEANHGPVCLNTEKSGTNLQRVACCNIDIIQMQNVSLLLTQREEQQQKKHLHIVSTRFFDCKQDHSLQQWLL
jgi:hypothetical protein